MALLHEDVSREIDESKVAASSYLAAFDEITADAHQRAQEFYRDLGFVASHVGMKYYLGRTQ